MSIYTKTGDDGKTNLFGGQRLSKSDTLFEVLGNLDELNASLGFLSSFQLREIKETLLQIQNDLFHMGAQVASPSFDDEKLKYFAQQTIHLENQIDKLDSELPELKNFILPGGTQEASYLHLSRVLCRQAERSLVKILLKPQDSSLLQYLNRLSDLLFVMARYVNYKTGVDDLIWKGDNAGTMDQSITRAKSISAVVINKEGKILVLKRSEEKKFNPGQWNIIAGKFDEEDRALTIEGLLKKEIKEETGCGLNILLSDIRWYVYQPDHDVIFEDHTFLVTLDSDDVQLNEEHTEYKWLSLEETIEMALVPFLKENLHQVGITDQKDAVYKVLYTNYKGATKWRYVKPLQYFYGSTEYHPEKQWFLKVFDIEKEAERTYALNDIQVFVPPFYQIINI